MSVFILILIILLYKCTQYSKLRNQERPTLQITAGKKGILWLWIVKTYYLMAVTLLLTCWNEYWLVY